ncbi:MAG: hypothetical protein NC078_12230 [Ruminococcus sp.]|nr:hypothetical protein [Ruminococcus sp.]
MAGAWGISKAAAAVAAIASAIAVADELNTIGNAMLYETVEAKKSKENVEEIFGQWDNISEIQGLEKYEEEVKYKEDLLTREEDWNKRYKSVSDELNALQEKKIKNADEVARQTELQNTKSTLDAEYETLELYGVKVNNFLDNYDSTTVGKLQETSSAQNQSIANAGRTNETALADVWYCASGDNLQFVKFGETSGMFYIAKHAVVDNGAEYTMSNVICKTGGGKEFSRGQTDHIYDTVRINSDFITDEGCDEIWERAGNFSLCTWNCGGDWENALKNYSAESQSLCFQRPGLHRKSSAKTFQWRNRA